ncbi:MAG: efflux RND transporter permease subunit, partial [Acidobacteriota bacterium]|nr:efflux RND transporter permease subunit [Acidobacteriota bacterium]
VGMLVDNSIVVLEAIDRRRREGLGRREAAGAGAGEVAGAVTAATLTTVCVFLPIIFVQGVAGQLFYDLAVTVCLSLVASLIVSLTLIPSMAAWDPGAIGTHAGRTLFRWDQGAEVGSGLRWTFRVGRLSLAPVGNGTHWLSKILTVVLFLPRLLVAVVVLALGAGLWGALKLFNLVTWPGTRLFDGIGHVYPGALSGALRWRWAILPLTVAILVLSVLSARAIGTQLVPDLAQGEFAFRLYLPEGTPLESTAEVIDRIERPLSQDTRFRRVFSVIGEFPSAASGRQERGENLAQINFVLAEGAGVDVEAAAVARVRDVLEMFPTVKAELVHPSVLTFEPPVGVQMFSDDLAQLETASAAMLRTMERLSSLRDVASSSEPGNPEIRIELDRERAAVLGVQADTMSRSLQRQIQGEIVGQFREAEERIDIRLRAAEDFRNRATRVEDLRIRLEDGTAVPVSAIADVIVDRGPASIDRIGGSRVVEITAQTSATDLGNALDEVRTAIAGAELPPGVVAELAGQDEELEVSFASLRLALGLALFLVYVVMAVQFESLVHPFVILLSVPMAIVGVVVALHLTGLWISVLVLIGVVMLCGIVVNNAIVMVDAINRRRREGESLDQAIVGAGRERLRPILMTTTTTILALLPMAMGLGAGDELRAPLAVTVIGGLTGATLLTLIVTPCLYRALSGRPEDPETATTPESTSGLSATPAVGGAE